MVEVNVGFGVVTTRPVSVETGVLVGDVLPGWTGRVVVSVVVFGCGACEDGCVGVSLVLPGVLCGVLEGEDSGGVVEGDTGVEEGVADGVVGEVGDGAGAEDGAAAEEGWGAIENERKHGQRSVDKTN